MKRIHRLRIKRAGIKITLTSFLLFICLSKTIHAQRVGIGTNNPLRKLSVTGSIQVDQNSNNTGTLDSAALVFGNAGLAGISSRQSGFDPNGLQFWTNNTAQMHLSPQGNLGLGGTPVPSYRLRVNGNSSLEGMLYVSSNIYGYANVTNEGNTGLGGMWDANYRLRVYDGNTRLGGDMHATGYVAFGGGVDSAYRLRVYDGNTRFGGDMHATGNVGVGGMPDDNFRLRVYNGSTRLEGNVQITGHTSLNTIGASGNVSVAGIVTAPTVNVGNSLTIDGKGSVRSNGPSALRVGFDERTVDIAIPANNGATVIANITDFSGGNDDVRIAVNQVEILPGSTLFSSNISILVVGIDPVANTCSLRIRNLSNVDGNLKATIYLTTIAKN